MRLSSIITNLYVFLLGSSISYAQIDVNTLLDLEITLEKKVDTLLYWSDYYADQYKFDSSIIIVKRALTLSDDNDYVPGQAMSEYNMAYAYDLSGQLTSAIEHYEKARSLYESIDDLAQVANCMNAKGVAAYFKGDFELALKYYLQTIEYCEANHITSVLINVLNNTGVIYRITSKQE